jgi:hypothetical protein
MILRGAERTALASVARAAMKGAMPWLAGYARLGHVAKGLVYVMAGGLALQAALGRGGQVTDGAGALTAMYRQPFGKITLVALGVGLLGFASLRLVQAIVDPQRRGRSPRMLALRAGEALTGLGHALLAWGAFRLVALGQRVPNGDQRTRLLAHDLLMVSHGDTVVMGLGLLVAVIGAVMLVRALTIENICNDLALERMKPSTRQAIAGILRFGRTLQGVLFGAVGIFLMRAASEHRPAWARGPAGAIRHLTQTSHGPFLLGLFALGLIAVALSCFIDALCQRFPAPGPLS